MKKLFISLILAVSLFLGMGFNQSYSQAYYQTIQLRRGTAAQWTAANPVLAQGEPGFETDTGMLKIGDGLTHWNLLVYQQNIVASPLDYKGVIDCGSNPNYPASQVGWIYFVSVAGKIGGGSGVDVEVGDLISCNTANEGGTQAEVGSYFNILHMGYIPLHAVSHQNGEADEISIDGLSGLLADDQHILDAEVLAVAEDKTKKGVASGYAPLGADSKVPVANLPGFSTLKFLATSVNKVSWTTAHGWTDVDISADVGSDTAKAALLNVIIVITESTGSYGSYDATARFRKNGSAITANLPRVFAAETGQGNHMSRASCSGMIIVELDGSEIFECDLVVNEPASGGYTRSLVVDLVGYFF